MRLAMFGGTFDPVHYGHLLLAECCREQAKLDEVWFIPAATPPHKQASGLSSAEDRDQMLRLAIGGHSQFRVSDIELQRAGVSYTVDTLREIHQTHPEAELFFLLGADMFNDLPHWKDPQEVCHLAQPLIVARAGCDKFDWKTLSTILDARKIEKIKNSVIHLPSIELSSTDIRNRVASRQSIRYRTPRAVEKYIEQKRLYVSKV